MHVETLFPDAEPMDYDTYYQDVTYNNIRRCKIMMLGQCLGKTELIQDKYQYIILNFKRNRLSKILNSIGITKTKINNMIINYVYPALLSRSYLVKNLERGCMNRAVEKAKKYNIRCVWSNKSFVDLYNDICYKLATNLDLNSPVKSNHLRQQLIETLINPIDVANLSSRDLCPKLVEKIENKISLRNNLERKIKYSELYHCKKCKRNQCTTERLYNRGLDEGVSLMILCGYCGNSWCD